MDVPEPFNERVNRVWMWVSTILSIVFWALVPLYIALFVEYRG